MLLIGAPLSEGVGCIGVALLEGLNAGSLHKAYRRTLIRNPHRGPEMKGRIASKAFMRSSECITQSHGVE